ARRVVETRGKVEDEAIASARAAGIADATIIEIVANVALNVFTNLINNVAHTEIDFPVVSAGEI
ncbi:carboxymuconolactone decarboxylase family protein, partial [Streptomyces galilaeus]